MAESPWYKTCVENSGAKIAQLKLNVKNWTVKIECKI